MHFVQRRKLVFNFPRTVHAVCDLFFGMVKDEIY